MSIDYSPAETGSGSQFEEESEVVRHLRFENSDNDLDNSELGINALMYAFADKYG